MQSKDAGMERLQPVHRVRMVDGKRGSYISRTKRGISCVSRAMPQTRVCQKALRRMLSPARKGQPASCYRARRFFIH
jgi:hypothetical protein